MIVEPDTILTEEQLLQEDWRIVTLIPITSGNEIHKWLAQRGLLINQAMCLHCRRPCSLNVFKKGIDGVHWSCWQCSSTRSIRADSFFTKSHLKLGTIVQLIYYWSIDMPQKQISRELCINKDTTGDWLNFIRYVCFQHITQNPIQLGGISEDGAPRVVEIDDSNFDHRKYHRSRGAWHPGHWVFGAIERGTGRCLIQEVSDREAETLQDLITNWILPGTIIISDGWPAYARISEINGGVYEHEVIDHGKRFVDPDDPNVHIQNIENLWMRAKRKLRQSGACEEQFTGYMAEFMWLQRFKNSNRFAAMLACIRTQCQL